MLLFDLVFFFIFFDTTQRIICEYSLKSVGGILCVLPGFCAHVLFTIHPNMASLKHYQQLRS